MLHFRSHAEKRIRKMSKERAIREVENGVNSHQFLYQSLGETWHQTGAKEKPAVAKAMAGEGGPSWARTSDPLIMSQVL